MNQQKWERDILNRQRNIVFPDTVLNEGRFYRNIASGKAVFSTGQKVSLAIVFAYFALLYSIFLASIIGEYRAEHNTGLLLWEIWASILVLGEVLFWTFLSVKAFFPSPMPARKRRRCGYRSSHRA